MLTELSAVFLAVLLLIGSCALLACLVVWMALLIRDAIESFELWLSERVNLPSLHVTIERRPNLKWAGRRMQKLAWRSMAGVAEADHQARRADRLVGKPWYVQLASAFWYDVSVSYRRNVFRKESRSLKDAPSIRQEWTNLAITSERLVGNIGGRCAPAVDTTPRTR